MMGVRLRYTSTAAIFLDHEDILGVIVAVNNIIIGFVRLLLIGISLYRGGRW
jgi:hypothetical protein